MSAFAVDTTRVPLSVCVLAYNDEAVLARCLDALGFADEVVVVVDTKTTDGTEKIAREKASVVSMHRYQGDIEQKSHAINLARNAWVLLLDSDEVVSPKLARGIGDFLRQRGDDAHVAGAEVNRLTYHLGRWIRHGDFYPDWKLRLFRRTKATVVGRNPHGRIQATGTIAKLPGDLEHYSYRDLTDRSQESNASARKARRRYMRREAGSDCWTCACDRLHASCVDTC